MIYVAGSLLSLVLLFAAWALSGAIVERLLGLNRLLNLALERWLVRLGLGCCLWILALFGLAACGLLKPLWIWSLLVVTGSLGLLLLARSQPEDDTQAPSTSAGDRPSTLESTTLLARLGALIVGTGLLFGAVVLSLQALRPDLAWDSNVYHLTLPRLFLERGGFYRVPFNVYSNWPLGTELLFASAMAVRDYTLSKLVHFGFGVATLVTVFFVASSRRRRVVGLWAVTLVLFNPVVLYEIRIAYIDLTMAFLLLIGFWAFSGGLDSPIGSAARQRQMLLAGIAAGALCSLKLNGFFGPSALLLVHACWHWKSHRTTKTGVGQWLREAMILGSPALVFGVPWLIKSWLLTGNPTYPLFFSLFGGPEWSLQLADLHSRWQSAIGMGRSLVDYLVLPFRVILQGDFGYDRFDGQIQRAWIVLLPIAFLPLRSDPLVRRALGVSGIYFVLWSVTSQQMRLLIPVIPLLATAAARGCALLVERLQRRRATLGSGLQLTLGVVLASLLLSAIHVYTKQAPRLARDLVTHGGDLRQAVVHPAYDWISVHLPADAGVLLLNTNHGFFVERRYAADSFFEASQISAAFADTTTPEDALARATELGLTHALILEQPGVRYPEALVGLVRDPSRSTTLYTSPDRRFAVVQLGVPDAALSRSPGEDGPSPPASGVP